MATAPQPPKQTAPDPTPGQSAPTPKPVTFRDFASI